MYREPKMLIIASVLAISACGTPDVDTSSDTFNYEKYTEDLSACRGGSAAKTFLGNLRDAGPSSMDGASEGASSAGTASDSAVGSYGKAILGGITGVFVGAYKPFQVKEESVRNCMMEKGYRVRS
ncbi:MAG: hypothetical protein HN578_21315 [Rhodospirillales bacterium]|jgi:hypothetical protein|nr:hypothetical protein [Rhodospirillaceae bacterium]MBT5036192.1 hypothetical protein [Rhodospirillaceae bacterium]MBT6364065.1 hypothetical protein [Rhodospirillaceae bacterium]MBT7486745.1 hypothetical protein [Rhodospirillales bacterium]MBT8005460.1 hypothetical protein [Rhodospirillales bacterium]